MADNHKQAIALFMGEADDGADAAVKAYAKKMLPALQQHLEMAQKLAKAAGAS